MLSILPSWKVTFLVTSKPTPPTVFNLQALDCFHYKEETRAYAQISRHTYKLFLKSLQIFKVVYFGEKNPCI